MARNVDKNENRRKETNMNGISFKGYKAFSDEWITIDIFPGKHSMKSGGATIIG